MGFRDLDVWKRSSRLAAELFKSTKDLRDFGFRDQLTRSGLSVPSNIAEGVNRLSDKETVHFLSVARGSAAELETQVWIGMEIDYLPREQGRQWIAEIRDIQSMLMGLIRRYRRTINDQRSKIKEEDDRRSTIDDQREGEL